MDSRRRRVVITGAGTVNPLGLNVEQTLEGLLGGKSGISQITGCGPTQYGFRTCIAGKINDFDPALFFKGNEIPRYGRFSQLALAAATQAVAQAGVDCSVETGDTRGVFMGVGLCDLQTVLEQYDLMRSKATRTRTTHSRISPTGVPKLMANAPTALLAKGFNCGGPCITISTACASGLNAMIAAVKEITLGSIDEALAGGTESLVDTDLPFALFESLSALSQKWNDTPTLASRPFDANRDGFVMSEGAAVFMLEELEHAQRRGADIFAEVVGYGETSDAYHVTAPRPDGSHAARAMRKAIQYAGITPGQISYVSAHGTATLAGDVAEVRAIVQVLGSGVPVSSIKGGLGHTIGAAGPMGALAALYAVSHGVAPHTVNLEKVDRECMCVDHIRGEPRTLPPFNGSITAMINAFGFGGQNACLVIRNYRGD